VTPFALALSGFAGVAALAVARARLDRSPGARRFFDAAARAELLFITLLLVTLVVLGGVQIFMRNVMHSGLLWADPLMRHIVLWLGATGAAMASARLRHISVDVLTRVLPASLRRSRRLAVYSFTAVAAYLLAVSAVRLVLDERSFGEVAFLGVRTWVVQLILPAAFLMVTYRTLLALFLGRESTEGIEG
jgi:TRAP-type C4-dicarboxylate transport system permease small subunit